MKRGIENWSWKGHSVLNHVIDDDDDDDDDDTNPRRAILAVTNISRRISLAWKAFWTLKFIIQEKTLSRKLRVEILETCVTPVLLYGCQTWSLTAKLRNSLQICQRKMLRRILGLSLRDRVPNEVLQKMSEIKDPALQATNTKWKWGGHVARLRDGRWTQKVTL
ncbi:hypothetical protein ANN_18180 [Periplaneta americana]|uniref:Endonuclease-reverse transcriptase n=1 Tax=Periplaneta americana TaxID=6978 RepID=A0ABQ8SN18_PERAM|nr:hypothetical protein ANN_18180 [Periplaneta americana]